jgi:hypothetical protein
VRQIEEIVFDLKKGEAPAIDRFLLWRPDEARLVTSFSFVMIPPPR